MVLRAPESVARSIAQPRRFQHVTVSSSVDPAIIDAWDSPFGIVFMSTGTDNGERLALARLFRAAPFVIELLILRHTG